jgi:hypothetical protein
MQQNLYADGYETLLENGLSGAADSVFVVDPSVEVLDAIATVGRETSEETPVLHTLARESVLKDVRDDFLIASRVADLVESGTVELRATSEPLHNTLVVGDESVVAFVSVDGQVAALAESDDTLSADTVARYRAKFDDAEPFTLRTPGRTRLLETLESEFDATMREDLRTVFDSADALTGEDGHLDVVQVCLLLAARHEHLLYDISGWGEDVGVASKATFSRTKTSLEEAGLIETEKVPLEVGRPRQRLIPKDEELAAADTSNLVAVVTRLLG